MILKSLFSLSKKNMIFVLILVFLIMLIIYTSLITTNSMISSMQNKLISLYDAHLKAINIREDERIEKDNRIKEVNKIIDYNSLIFSKKESTQMLLKRVEQDFFTKDRMKDLNLKDLDLSKENSIIISKSLAKKLKVQMGDDILVLASSKDKAKMQLFNIRALFNTDYAYLDDKIGYLYNNKSLDILKERVNLYINIYNIDEIDEIKSDLLNKGFDIISFKNNSLLRNFDISKASMNLVFSLLLLVALLYIILSSKNIQKDNAKTLALLNISGQSSFKIIFSYSFIISSLILIIQIPAFLLSILVVKVLPSLILSNNIFNYYIKDFAIKIPILQISIMLISFICLVFITFYLSFKIGLKKSIKKFLQGL